jgi:mRNA interferase RelE/StbE
MGARPRPFNLFFEMLFLESYSELGPKERKAIDRAVQLLAENPRHPSLQVHKARHVQGKYFIGGPGVFIAYATKDLRITFEYGPEPGSIALRNCGFHDACESNI